MKSYRTQPPVLFSFLVPGLLMWLVPAAPGPMAGETGIDALLRQGEALYATHHLGPDRLDQAIGFYKQALALDPAAYRILWKLSEMYQIYGQTLDDAQAERKAALWEEGIAYGKRAVKANPEGHEGHFYYMANMGALAQLQGALSSLWKMRKIRKEMERAYELNPDFPPVLIAKAQYLTGLPGLFGGSEQEAVALYQRVLELDERYPIVYYYLAELDVKHGRYDDAVKKLETVIHFKDPIDPANWFRLERVWAERLLDDLRSGRIARDKDGP